jgi:methionine-rich copper-binding protein CopC
MKKLIVFLSLMLPAIASAHVQPDHADPAVGSTVKATPKEVKIWFDGPVGVDKSHIDVLDAGGKSVVTGQLHGDAKDKTLLAISITAGSGKLTVKWEAYCPDCEHTTQGTYTFTIEP